MRVPARPSVVATVGATLALVLLGAPVVALLARTPLPALGQALGGSGGQALRLSLVSSAVATLVCVALGLPLAWMLARVAFPGRRWVRALAVLPMVLPPVVGGVALLAAFGRNGLAGRLLDQVFGIQLPFSTAGVVVAQTFVALPFFVVAAEAGLRGVDLRLEEAARACGASPAAVFRRVTLPLARPSLVAGGVLCWARALGEFGATITFAGNFPGRTRTAPLEVFLLLQTEPAAAYALSLVLVVVSIAVLVGLRQRWLGPLPGPHGR